MSIINLETGTLLSPCSCKHALWLTVRLMILSIIIMFQPTQHTVPGNTTWSFKCQSTSKEEGNWGDFVVLLLLLLSAIVVYINEGESLIQTLNPLNAESVYIHFPHTLWTFKYAFHTFKHLPCEGTKLKETGGYAPISKKARPHLLTGIITLERQEGWYKIECDHELGQHGGLSRAEIVNDPAFSAILPSNNTGIRQFLGEASIKCTASFPGPSFWQANPAYLHSMHANQAANMACRQVCFFDHLSWWSQLLLLSVVQYFPFHVCIQRVIDHEAVKMRMH